MKFFVAVRWSLAVVFLAAAVSANAQGPPSGPGGPGFGGHRPPMEEALGPRGTHGRWWNDPAMVEKLSLTEDQRKAMDSILLEHREKLIDMRAAVDKAELEMEPLMRADQPNETQILAQIDKVAQARAELEKANARFLLEIRGKLTPDQWKTLQSARADRMQQRHSWQEREQNRRLTPPPQGAPGAGPQGMLRPPPGPDGPPIPGNDSVE